MKIINLVGDLSYKEIKERRWRTPRLWKWNDEKILFMDYIISKDGIILRIKKKNNSLPGKQIKTWAGRRGYLTTILCLNKKVYAGLGMHRLLWETWIGRVPKGLQINHKDGIKNNNDLDNNLEVVTPKENMQHAIRIGLHWTKKHRKNIGKITRKRVMGENNFNTELTQKKVDKIRFFSYEKRWVCQKIANKFGVSMSCVYRILRGESWNPDHLTVGELVENYRRFL